MLGSTRYTVDEDETESVAESYEGGHIGIGDKTPVHRSCTFYTVFYFVRDVGLTIKCDR